MREHKIARAAAARLLAAQCRGLGQLWTCQEQLHEQATSPGAATAAAAPLLEVCAACPITGECQLWARADLYTGIAAGTAWKDGELRDPNQVPGHPVRRPPLPLAS